MTPARARTVHLVVAAVAWGAVALQLALVLGGSAVLVDPRETAYALCWPVAWVVWTLVVGQVDGWVPYPFLDASEEGWGAVVVACVGITVLFLAVFALLGWLDRRLRPAPGGPRHA